MEKTVAILMADLSGFTAMTEIHGPEAAAEMIETYTALVKKSLRGESFMLERVGDQVVVISPDPDDLAETALALFDISENENHFLAIHAGMHYGIVLDLDGHYYGSAVNLTSRIAAKARKGKILCSKDFVDALSNTAAFRYAYHGSVNFKNIFESKEIVELLPIKSNSQAGKNLCPVCHMRLDATEISFSYRQDDHWFYFCSEECKMVFEKYQLYNVSLAS